jgi:hypothetical protein
VKCKPEQKKIKAQIKNPQRYGVSLGFSQNELKRESTRITSKNCIVWAYTVIQRVYLLTNPIPRAPISQELEGSPQIHKRREREKPRTQDFRISTRMQTKKEI